MRVDRADDAGDPRHRSGPASRRTDAASASVPEHIIAHSGMTTAVRRSLTMPYLDYARFHPENSLSHGISNRGTVRGRHMAKRPAPMHTEPSSDPMKKGPSAPMSERWRLSGGGHRPPVPVRRFRFPEGRRAGRPGASHAELHGHPQCRSTRRTRRGPCAR